MNQFCSKFNYSLVKLYELTELSEWHGMNK